MGTISAIIIICCLIICAALTVVIILVTIPTEITPQSYYPELLINRESTHNGIPVTNYLYFHPNKKMPHNLKKDALQNSTVSADVDAVSATTITITSATSAITITKTTIYTTTFPSTAEISELPLQNDKLPYQSAVPSTTVPIKTWKPIHNHSSQRRTTMFLSTNITITQEKKVTSSSQRLATESRHRSISQESTPRNLRQNFATLMLHQHIEQLPLNDDDNLVKSGQEKKQTMQMTLLREVTFSNDVKVVGLAMQRGVLYVATSDGRITLINPETIEQIETISVDGKINRMTVTHNVDIIVLNGTSLISYRHGQKYREIKLPIVGKSLSAFKDEIGLGRIITLGRSNDVLFVFTDDLKPIEEIYYKNVKETCNFAILYQKYYYISCQSAILQISEDGEIKKKIGANNGTFSLGITIDDEARIIAVVRGQPLLRVFQNGELQYNLSAVSADEVSAIWSEVLYEKGRLHIVDYLTSKLKTFRYPISSTDSNA